MNGIVRTRFVQRVLLPGFVSAWELADPGRFLSPVDRLHLIPEEELRIKSMVASELNVSTCPAKHLPPFVDRQ